MSGTMVFSASMTHTNDLLSLPVQSETTTITQITQGLAVKTPLIGIVATAIDTSDIDTLGVTWFKNLDEENFVDVGSFVDSAFRPFGRLLAGERFPFRLTPGIVLYAQANTDPVKLQVSLYEA